MAKEKNEEANISNQSIQYNEKFGKLGYLSSLSNFPQYHTQNR